MFSCPPWSAPMMAWGSWDEAAFDAYLPSNMILAMADIAVIVTDRLTNLLYMNGYAARLFRQPGDAAGLAGHPILSLGLVADGDLRQMEDLTAIVLRGRSWEGTFESMRGDGTHALVRALAVPLRHPAGDIDGIVILAREVSQRAGRRSSGWAAPSSAPSSPAPTYHRARENATPSRR